MIRVFRATLLLLIVVCIAISLVSCGNRKYDEATVLEQAKRLVEESAVLNQIYYGEGIGYIKDESYASGYYYPADGYHLSVLGISTLDDLIKKTEKTYSADMVEVIKETRLSSISGEKGVLVYARYYQKYDSLDLNSPECIMVYSKAENLFTDEVEYLTDTMKVLFSKGEIVYLTLDVKVTNSDGETQHREMEIGIIEEEDGWKLTTHTLIKYNPYENNI